MNIKAFARKTVLILHDLLKRHWIFAVCVCIGLLAGPYGAIAGLFTGFFVELIVNRIKDERSLKNVLKGGKRVSDKNEPFPGAVYACALACWCLGDSASAARGAALVFGPRFKADWNSICRSSIIEDFNKDLAVENLASVLLHEKETLVPVTEIFAFLRGSEFAWDEDKGEKPSVYLASLLNYSVQNDEAENAYLVLGLNKDSPLDEVKRAHRRLAAKFHPDSGTEKNDAEFIRVQKAYEVIIQRFAN